MTTTHAHDGSTGLFCEYGTQKRTRYFHGMLLDDLDFITEQNYHLERQRKLNRYLWGTGVICGLDLVVGSGAQVQIQPGAAIDCNGELIEVERPITVDLSSECRKDCGCQAGDKPELCSDGEHSREFYLGLRYAECESDNVAAYLPGGDCDRPASQPSRIREGFCVEVLDDPTDPCALPSTSGRHKSVDDWCEVPVPCPTCCSEHHAVVLGRVEVRCGPDEAKQTYSNDRREYVLSAPLIRHLSAAMDDADIGEEIRRRLGISKSVEDLSWTSLLCNPLGAICELGSSGTEARDERPAKAEQAAPQASRA